MYKLKSVDDELIWFKNLFLHNNKLIKDFLDIKQCIEINILNSEVKQALTLLDSIDDNICLSLWGIEIRIHIMKELSQENTSEYLSDLKNDANNSITNFFTQQMLLKSESKDIDSFVDNLKEVLSEMRNTDCDSEIMEFTHLCSSFLIPYELDTEREVNNRRLYNFTNYSLIDQYILFKSYVTDKILYGEGLSDIELLIIKQIQDIIQDNEIINLFKKDINLTDIDNTFLDIIKKYTEDNYVKSKNQTINLLKTNPLATSLLDIYARANIYTNTNNTQDTYYQYISYHLENILLGNGKTLESISELKKIVIKFHLSNWSIPIALYKFSLIDEKKEQLLIIQKKAKLLGISITPNILIDYNYDDLITLLNVDKTNL
ncbi:MAG: hypothetical protein KAJ49_02225, partial [Arcobacteraceae bacterium]|nr:hypothetical protein [Arcobacteraceae bacterium]